MATDDDIFASLGGSLMEDLMSDINAAASAAGPSGGDGGGDDINFTLASLERELADFTGGNDDDDAAGNQSTLLPPHATPQPSAASMVVNHAAERGKFDAPSAPSSMPAQRDGNGGEDAWSVSLSKFSALSLAEDFLKADSAKKMGGAPAAAAGPPPGIGAPVGIGGGGGGGEKLTFEDAEDYDVKEKVLVGGPPGLNVPPPPGVGRPPMQGPPAAVGPPPGHGAPPQKQQHHQQMAQQMQQQKGAPGLNVPPPPGVAQQAPPPGVGPPGHRPPPQQQQHQQQQQQQQGQMSGMRPPEVGLPSGPPLQGNQRGGVPPGAMMLPPGQGMPPPHIMAMMQQQQMQGRGPGGPPPPNMMGMPPAQMMGMPPPQGMGGPPPPMGVGRPPQMGMQPPPPHVIQRQMQQGQVQGPPQHLQGLPPPPQKEDPLEAESAFKKKDFPTLGKAVAVTKDSDNKDAKGDSDKGKEEEEDDGEAPLIPSKASQALPSTPTKAPVPEPQIQRRVIFNDPNPGGHPVPATVVQSSLMPPRDLCYVVHSMIRPLHTSDRYSDDYYHWSYVDRQSRNILMLGVGGSSGGTNLPAPVWKETKVKAQAAEEKYIASVESRAKDWMEDKGTLGHVVKTNVKRPRALLSTPVLSRKDSQGSEDEEDGIRVGLWKARVAIDRGYGAYLRLVELRRLLQSDGKGARNPELVKDAEEEVSNLHSSLGVTVKQEPESAPEICVDPAILARTLSLPKGRLLLARLVEGGILPHPSACKILPAVVAVLFSVKPPSGGAPPPGEDRLLRSLTGLVRTVQPSLGSRDILSCLDAVMELDDHSKGGEGIGMAMSSRTRIELIHSVLSRGGMICVQGEEGKEWKEKEGRFMTMLQQSQGGGQKTSGL